MPIQRRTERPFPWKSAGSIYESNGPDGPVTFEMAGHVLCVEPTTEIGVNTGRHRYRVRCRTCSTTIHEATTGPANYIEEHIDRASMLANAPPFGTLRSEAEIKRDIERAGDRRDWDACDRLEVELEAVKSAGPVRHFWRGAEVVPRAFPIEAARQRICRSCGAAMSGDRLDHADNCAAAATEAGLSAADASLARRGWQRVTVDVPIAAGADRPTDDALRGVLQESLDWITIRALAAGRVAELLAFATNTEQPPLGMLSASDLERLQRRVTEWLPGQPPRTQADVHNGNEVARLTRELDKARDVIHGKIRMAKEPGDE